MKRIIKNTTVTICLLVFAFTLASCDMTNTEYHEPIKNPNYPLITINSSFTGQSVTEGDTITYTITSDMPLANSADFELALERRTEKFMKVKEGCGKNSHPGNASQFQSTLTCDLWDGFLRQTGLILFFL